MNKFIRSIAALAILHLMPGAAVAQTTAPPTGLAALGTPGLASLGAINVRDATYGATPAAGDGVTDDSAALIAADAYAAAHGYRYLYFPPRSYKAPSLGTVGSGYLPHTILIGDGVITSGKYRQVTPASAFSPPASPTNDLIPSKHLIAAATKPPGSPLVVDMMGDSTCTPYANEIAPSEYMAPAIQAQIQASNPGRVITFNNRCVGGQAWSQANGLATSNQPPWLTPTTTPWLNFVSADAPDLLLFNFGMNPDAQSVSVADFHGVMTKVAAFAKVPSIVFITNKEPSYNPTGTFGGYPLDQENRYVTAGYTRTYAKANGYGLLDFNRRFRIVRDGVDVADQHMVASATNLTGQSFPSALPQSQGDFDLQLTFSGAAIWSSLTNITIPIGNRSDNVLALTKDSGSGNLQVNTYEGASFPINGFITGTPATPGAGNITLEVMMKAGQLTLVYDGVTIINAASVPVMGGPFAPTLSAAGSAVGSVAFTVASGSVGVARTYMPSVTDADLYHAAATMGGNTLNHCNSSCISAVETPVIAASRFTVAEAVNPLNPLGTPAMTVNLSPPGALGGVAGNQQITQRYDTNVGANIARLLLLDSRAAAGTSYGTAEKIWQYSVDASAFSAFVFNPYAFPQGASVRIAGVDKLAVDAAGNVVVGGSLAGSATSGFTLVSTTNAAPSGTPGSTYGRAPMAVDTLDSKVCFWISTAWKCAVLN